MDIRIFDSITQCDPEAWNKLAGTAFPFASYHFLHALETTDCLGERTGWYPTYLVAQIDGHVVGALICFAKGNSYGEYIFDWAWAEGAQAAGLAYYPKLTSAIPFTPATGSKLLIAPDLSPGDAVATRGALIAELKAFALRSGLSSVHALFLPEDELAAWTGAGFVLRDSFQFHWVNEGYRDFGDFLDRLKGKRRREIRRERAQVAASGVRISRLTGADLTPERAAQFNEFYLSTIDKRGSFDYLTAPFFERVFQTMADRILLVWAEAADGRPVAGALNYVGDQTLFGRHWGCLAEYRALHFEVCYYQGLEYAIERGLGRFEAGAQGEHKLQRGFLPTKIYSAHRIAHPGLDRAVQNFIEVERRHVSQQMTELNAHSPFGYVETPLSEVAP